MRITFDPTKRAATLEDRGLDFIDASEVFDGITAEAEDTRRNYGERRIICFGLLRAVWCKSSTRREMRGGTSSA